MKLKLGTRGSDLALTQSRWVKSQLEAAGAEVELEIISTSGDRSTAPTFGAIGPQGVFVREIEQALIDGAIDLAVHSYKDLPTASPPGLVIGAVPPREDPADWLLVGTQKRGLTPISRKGGLTPISDLPAGTRVGTSSARRQAWLRHFNSDLVIEPLRGNVPTRLRRLAEGDFDAILLAGAGIARLEASSDVLETSLAGLERLRLDPQGFVPAPAQGALAVQCREADDAIRELLSSLDDDATRGAVDLERRALALAEGGCDTAFGAYAERQSGVWDISVMIERDGAIHAARIQGDADALENRAMQALARQTAGPS